MRFSSCFTESPHGEAHLPQGPPARPVAPAVAGQLREPILLVRFRHVAVLGAAVVEALSAKTARRRPGTTTSGLPWLGAHIHVYPPPSAQGFGTEAQSLASGVVPELLMRDMISLRFSRVKTSAISPRPRLAVRLPPAAGMRRRGIWTGMKYTSDAIVAPRHMLSQPRHERSAAGRVYN